MSTPEGYATPEGNSYRYVYQFKDHLDNVRLSYTKNDAGTLEIVEESNYYPFGLTHKGYNSSISSLGNSTAQLLGFGGKEEQNELGLEWLDFSARNYDAALGRWFVIDPLADAKGQIHNSTYAYAMNNPVIFTDPDGNCPPGVDCLPAPVDSSLEGAGGSVNTSVSRSGSNINVSTSVTVGNTTKTDGGQDIKLASTVKQEHVTDKSAVVVAKNLDASGNKKAQVNSAFREPKDQARAMFTNLKNKGVKSQKRLYSAAGDKVIDVYAGAKAFNSMMGKLNEMFDADLPQISNSEIKANMTETINEVGPGAVSKHSSDPNTYNVLDLSHSQMKNKKAFHRAVTSDSNIKKVKDPYNSDDPAFHIEIPQQ